MGISKTLFAMRSTVRSEVLNQLLTISVVTQIPRSQTLRLKPPPPPMRWNGAFRKPATPLAPPSAKVPTKAVADSLTWRIAHSMPVPTSEARWSGQQAQQVSARSWSRSELLSMPSSTWGARRLISKATSSGYRRPRTPDSRRLLSTNSERRC